MFPRRAENQSSETSDLSTSLKFTKTLTVGKQLRGQRIGLQSWIMRLARLIGINPAYSKYLTPRWERRRGEGRNKHICPELSAAAAP